MVKLGGEGNTIGGWTITNDQIQSDNLIIHSSGRLETSDFASGVKGGEYPLRVMVKRIWKCVIRGTLKTAVFEKETVNAVVVNCILLTQHYWIRSDICSFATMSVVNVSGFEKMKY